MDSDENFIEKFNAYAILNPLGVALDGAAKVLSDLASGNFRVSPHARQRMSQRGATDHDLMSCGETGKAKLQDNGRYKIEGFDLDGDEIEVVCADVGETIVVTLF